jgi:threonine aldolase
MQSVCDIAKKFGAPAHLDGARLFNAAAALGVPALEIARHCDTLSFCLSKGLSAPFGAVLLGGRDFIKRARLYRRMLGSGFRQIGLMAAPGLVALNTMVARLAEDNRRCAELWALLREFDPRLVYAERPASNIMHVCCVQGSSQEWVDALKAEGVLCFADGPQKLRFVTHRHIADEDLPRIAAIVRKIHTTFGG